MELTQILTHFGNVRQNGGQYRADCPACGDSKQHLGCQLNKTRDSRYDCPFRY